MRSPNPMEALADLRHEFGEHGGVNMSIEASSTFTVMQADLMPEIFQGRRSPGRGGCYLYGRHFNPTVYVLGRQIAALEGTESGYCTASGMAAISAAIMQLCGPGDHIVASNAIYGGTFALFQEFLTQKAGLQVSFVDTTDLEATAAAFQAGTRLLYTESMSNPTLSVPDIPALARLAHERNCRLIVDNTFTPLVISPARLGADIVIHSLTKFINGASDIIAGAICSNQDFISQLMNLHTGALMLMGPTMDPEVAFRISLRVPHLGLRMVEHSRRALAYARRLEAAGLKVIYPGLPSHPNHATLRKIGNPHYGCGGVLCLDLEETARANEFMEILQNRDRFGFIAVSLGYFESLISCSASSTSSEMPCKAQQAAGISPGLVRISVGYTGSLEQRWSQLEEALQVLKLI